MFGLFQTQTAASVGFALDAADTRGLICVINAPRIGNYLAERSREVLQVSSKLRSLRRARGQRMYGDGFRLPIADGAVDAIVSIGLATDADWQARLAEQTRVVRDGGLVVFVDRCDSHEPTRLALCSGLVEIEQRHAGRTLVTSGTVFGFTALACEAG